MTAPAFTPGPWFVERDEDDEFQVASNDDWRICDLNNASRYSRREANARLIAAAPKMFEALREARLALETLARRVFNDNGDHTINTEPLDPGVYSACYYAARTVEEVLAKATGQ